jgi:hypothetical protein
MQSLEHFKVKQLVSSLTLYKFKLDEPFDVKEEEQHGFRI